MALSAGEARNYEPPAEQLLATLKNLLNAMKRKAKSPAARQRKQRDIRRHSKRFLGQSQARPQAFVHPCVLVPSLQPYASRSAGKPSCTRRWLARGAS